MTVSASGSDSGLPSIFTTASDTTSTSPAAGVSGVSGVSAGSKSTGGGPDTSFKEADRVSGTATSRTDTTVPDTGSSVSPPEPLGGTEGMAMTGESVAASGLKGKVRLRAVNASVVGEVLRATSAGRRPSTEQAGEGGSAARLSLRSTFSRLRSNLRDEILPAMLVPGAPACPPNGCWDCRPGELGLERYNCAVLSHGGTLGVCGGEVDLACISLLKLVCFGAAVT